MKCNFILYVRDQEASTGFYIAVLAMEPILNVPGMTEFELSSDCVLGLMPERTFPPPLNFFKLILSSDANPNFLGTGYFSVSFGSMIIAKLPFEHYFTSPYCYSAYANNFFAL